MEFLNGAVQTVINFFKALWDSVQRGFDWLNDAYDSIIQFFKDLPEWIFSKFADALIAFYQKIPVPEFFNSAANAFSNIPAEVVYFAQPFQITYGITVVLGAYLLRFITRRIPIIG